MAELVSRLDYYAAVFTRDTFPNSIAIKEANLENAKLAAGDWAADVEAGNNVAEASQKLAGYNRIIDELTAEIAADKATYDKALQTIDNYKQQQGNTNPDSTVVADENGNTATVRRDDVSVNPNAVETGTDRSSADPIVVGNQHIPTMKLGGAPTYRSGGKPAVKDFSHASKLFVSDNYKYSPKYAWLYHVYFDIDPTVTRVKSDLLTVAGMLVKSVTLPKFTIDAKTLNSYNRAEIVQTKIKYDPVTVTFHDDSADLIRSLWFDYYHYYYRDADPGYSDDKGSVSEIFNMMPTAQKYGPRTYNGWGYGTRDASKARYIRSITLYSLHQHKFSMYTLVNPVITSFQHGTFNSSDQGILEHQMTISYEAVLYGDGQIGSQIVKGFADAIYDKEVSPLSKNQQAGTMTTKSGGQEEKSNSAIDYSDVDYWNKWGNKNKGAPGPGIPTGADTARLDAAVSETNSQAPCSVPVPQDAWGMPDENIEMGEAGSVYSNGSDVERTPYEMGEAGVDMEVPLEINPYDPGSPDVRLNDDGSLAGSTDPNAVVEIIQDETGSYVVESKQLSESSVVTTHTVKSNDIVEYSVTTTDSNGTKSVTSTRTTSGTTSESETISGGASTARYGDQTAIEATPPPPPQSTITPAQSKDQVKAEALEQMKSIKADTLSLLSDRRALADQIRVLYADKNRLEESIVAAHPEADNMGENELRQKFPEYRRMAEQYDSMLSEKDRINAEITNNANKVISLSSTAEVTQIVTFAKTIDGPTPIFR